MLKFYPEMQKKKDNFLTEFLATKQGNPNILNEKLDPDVIGYNQPDFGYDCSLSLSHINPDDYEGLGWRKFMDCVATYPKYERVQNYIDLVNQKNIAKLSKQEGNAV